MAYNNGFPMGYQPYYQQPIQPMPQQQVTPQPQAQQNNPMIWVQGETGAKSYLLAPNTTLPLWDSESQTIYLKSTDSSGMPTMKTLDYTIRDQGQIPTKPVVVEESVHVDYVTHDELKALEERLLSKLTARPRERNNRNERRSNNANAYSNEE